MANKNDIKDLVVCAFRGTNPDPTKFSNSDIISSVRVITRFVVANPSVLVKWEDQQISVQSGYKYRHSNFQFNGLFWCGKG